MTCSVPLASPVESPAMIGTSLLGQLAPAVLADVRGTLERQFTESLQGYAQASGWPADVSSQLTVKHGESGFDVSIPEPHEGRVLDLEYGTQSTPPNAVLRKFKQRIGKTESGEALLELVGGLL